MTKVTAVQTKAKERSSRQIQVVLRNHETNVYSEATAGGAAAGTPYADQALNEWMKPLNDMIGLDHVKELIYEIYALLQINRYRSEAGLHSESQVYHMIFKGNPGTGKTTVARIVAKMFHSMGVLSKGHFIEAERADLVGEYIGHTALKTRELVKRSLGGVLFVDEAYSLARGGEKDFGKEAIDALVKSMEDHRSDFVLILAGYPNEMYDFIEINPGLSSRFPLQIDFPDFSVDQLMQIYDSMIKERDYSTHPQTVSRVRQHLLQEKSERFRTFSNARHVRNLIEKSIRHHAVRLLSQAKGVPPSKEELMLIRPEDMKL